MKKLLLHSLLVLILISGCATFSNIPLPVRDQLAEEWVGRTVWFKDSVSSFSHVFKAGTKVTITKISYAPAMIFHFQDESGREGKIDIWYGDKYDKQKLDNKLKEAFYLEEPFPATIKEQLAKEWVGRTVWIKRTVGDFPEGTKVTITKIAYEPEIVFHFQDESGRKGEINVWPHIKYDKVKLDIALKEAFYLEEPFPATIKEQLAKEWVGRTVWLKDSVRSFSHVFKADTKVTITKITYEPGMIFHFQDESGRKGEINVWPHIKYDKVGLDIALKKAFYLEQLPEYTFVLIEPVENTLEYNDDFVSINFVPFISFEKCLKSYFKPVKFRIDGEDRISFSIKNKTGAPIKIIWDQCAYIDPAGNSHRIMHEGVKFIDRNKSQPSTIIPPKAKITDFVIPTDHISFDSFDDEWCSKGLFYDFYFYNLGKVEFGIMLAIEIEKEIKFYTFRFKIIEYTEWLLIKLQKYFRKD